MALDIQKKNRIAAIKDEKKELHPLLNMLLRNLPDVKTVEYTHGANEMGADFIYSKLDAVLENTFWGAIVAKVGRLEQAAVPELSRQIKEAFYPKLVQSGKQKITVSEILVVTNLNISHGAKEAIHNEFSGRKIEFITGDDLVKIISRFFPSYWTDISLELGQYLYSLRVHNEEIEQSVCLTNMARGVYIEQDIVRAAQDSYEKNRKKNKPRLRVDIFDLITRDNFILIEGEMGAGKSKLTRRLVEHFTTPQVYLDNFIVPIITTYKDLLDKYSCDFEKLIFHTVGEKAQQEVSKEAKYLLIVDGIDEKNISAEEHIKIINKFVADAESRDNIKLVLTTRYLGSIDKKQLSGKITHLELLSLTPTKLLEFVKKICSAMNISDRIFTDIRRSPLFKDMPRSPIAAILLADIIKQNSQDLPSNLPELYSKYIELTLGRWDCDKGLQSLKEFETLWSIMMELAQLSIANELQFIMVAEVKEICDNYLKVRRTGVSSERVFQLMRERCPIVIVDEKEGRFQFKHRTFAEFLYAQYLLKKKQFKIDNRAFQPYWSNTYYFAIGTLRDCYSELEQLKDLRPETDVEKFLKIVNMSNFFMAAFQTEYKVIIDGVRQIITEAANFYKDILLHKLDTKLDSFPEMHLLCFFQQVLRQGYSYSFFSEAVESAAIEIANSHEDDDVKAYALFFLNVIFIDMKKKDSFDWLLKDYAKILPLSVQLGIAHEGDRLKARSALMRRQDRALRHAVSQSKELSSALETMYGRPIHSLRQSVLKKC
ncbi:MAG: NACHT domain-containing protein [Candidatus Pacebacteria bacterium]|nr:NACHT domain-containing protein [Candidatus Paceibacterota bacterium]